MVTTWAFIYLSYPCQNINSDWLSKEYFQPDANPLPCHWSPPSTIPYWKYPILILTINTHNKCHLLILLLCIWPQNWNVSRWHTPESLKFILVATRDCVEYNRSRLCPVAVRRNAVARHVLTQDKTSNRTTAEKSLSAVLEINLQIRGIGSTWLNHQWL